MEKLSQRELEIVRLSRMTLPTRKYATSLISVQGILKLHRNSIIRKLGTRGNAGIVLYAILDFFRRKKMAQNNEPSEPRTLSILD